MYQRQQFEESNRVKLFVHFRDEQIPLVIYRGTSEQVIYEQIRELTNLYRFKALNKKEQPLILSSNLPDKTHIYIQDPTLQDKKEEESDEPTPEQQIEYLKPKIQEVIDAKNLLNVFKKMLLNLEAAPPANPDDENKEQKTDEEAAADGDQPAADGDADAAAASTEQADATTTEEDTAPKEEEPAAATEDEAKQEADAAAGDQPADAANAAETTDEAAASGLPPPNAADEEQKEHPDEFVVIDPKQVKYEGKYKALMDEIESKLDELQTIIMEYYELSPDLLPPKPSPEEETKEDAVDSDEELTEEQKDQMLLDRLVAKMQPDMQQQIQMMQQLLQMQQMSMMQMMSAGGAAAGAVAVAGGAVPAINSALGPYSPLPAMGAHASINMLSPIGAAGGNAPQLQQSNTSEAKEEVEEKKEVVVDRTKEFKNWFGGSNIIEDDEYKTLMDFFPDNGKNVKKLERVFTASVENFSASAFHDKCDDVGPTLVMIQSEFTHVFGGFTKESWASSGTKGQWKVDESAFIYLLRSPKDDVYPQRWMVVPEKKEKTIRADKKYGPSFGYGYDIRICDQCHSDRSSVCMVDREDASFSAKETVNGDDEYMAGDDYYLVKEYEVYKFSEYIKVTMAFQPGPGLNSRAVNIVQDLLDLLDQNASKSKYAAASSRRAGHFPPSSTRVKESAIINARIDVVWDAIKSATFDFLSSVKSCQMVPPKSSPNAVGNTRLIVYNDGASQTIKISSISLLKRRITYSVISSLPSTAYSSADHEIRLFEVTLDGRTYIEWTTDFSTDASMQVIEDSRFKKKEAFRDLVDYLSVAVIVDHDEDDEKSHDMLSVNVQRTTDIGIEKIWKMVSNFGDVSFSSMIEKCSLAEGGKVRHIVVKNKGGEYSERLVAVNAKEYAMQYEMIKNTAMPITNCITTVRLTKQGKKGCKIQWSARFKAHEVGDSLAKRTMQELLDQGVNELLRSASK